MNVRVDIQGEWSLFMLKAIYITYRRYPQPILKQNRAKVYNDQRVVNSMQMMHETKPQFENQS